MMLEIALGPVVSLSLSSAMKIDDKRKKDKKSPYVGNAIDDEDMQRKDRVNKAMLLVIDRPRNA